MKLQLIVDDDGAIKSVGHSQTARLVAREGERLIEVDGPDDEQELRRHQGELLSAYRVEMTERAPKLVRRD
jgi:hypothetical protein